MFKGRDCAIVEASNNLNDFDIASYYFGITKLPTRICSPLREDKKPSFGLFTRDGVRIFWTDFATGERGSIIELLQKLWVTDYKSACYRIAQEMNTSSAITYLRTQSKLSSVNQTGVDHTIIETKEREWNDDDINYWASYGVSIEWLKYANVHPISHIIFTKNNNKTVMLADKLAYAYVEFKEGNTTIKVYQPHNTNGFKWLSTHDRSVVSLWTKVPEFGHYLVICSSLKDALCLWSNTGIPAIAPQGEGYSMSQTAINDLKLRYDKVFILYDNDQAGITDSKRLTELTGFTNIQLPQFTGGKDVSDLYKVKGKEEFLKIILPLIK